MRTTAMAWSVGIVTEFDCLRVTSPSTRSHARWVSGRNRIQRKVTWRADADADQLRRYRISRELLATTATDDALCRSAANTGESAPPAPMISPAALTAMDMP